MVSAQFAIRNHGTARLEMLFEAIEYLTTSCRPEFRKLGYLHELVGLQARSKRQARLWQPHYEYCRRLIQMAIRLCPFHRRVIVLGSGLLKDVPLETLAESFGEVVLVDVVHLKEVRQRVAAFGNVRMVEADVTGLALPLTNMARNSKTLPEPRASIPQLSEDTDLVISANLLSQLCVVPLNYVLGRGFDIPEPTYIEWCQQIIQSHIDALLASNARVCLFTDLVHVETDRQGEEIRREDMLFEVNLPDAAWLWDWELAPYGEVSHQYRVTAVVSGFVNFPYPGE